MPSAEISLNEREFIKQGLRESIRLDGRAFDEFRKVELNFGEEYGVADVRLGKTRVIVRISSEVVPPFPDRKFDGIFNISTELSPMASPAFETNRPSNTETLLSRILEKSIRRSGALDTESLCIIAGQKCFSVRADVHVLSHDGGLIDASCIALIAALRHYKRPDVSVDGQEVTIYSSREREPVPLAMLHHPLCVTFSFFENGSIMLVDAEFREEECRQGSMVISMNRHGEICQIAKYGGVTVDALSLLGCTSVALEKVKVLSKIIQDGLDEDAKRRDVGGLMAELSAENDRPEV